MAVLDGIRVLDLSRVFAAPLATQMLADLGAEVWKIESPSGDDTRKWGDHVFNAFNRGKRGLAVNLKHERAQRLIQRLAGKADVLVENFKTGDLPRYGLGYETLSKINERLVYVSLTGFGQTGPRKNQPGYDTIIQAMAGVMHSTGDPDGPPSRVGIAWVDVMAGLTTALAVMSALLERKSSGKGQHIDLGLFDVGLMALIDVAQDYLQNGNVQRRMGNITRNLSPAQTFETSDGWIVLAVGNDGQFGKLCAEVGLPGLASDPRFATNLLRVENREALTGILTPVIRQVSRQDMVERLNKAGIPASPILDSSEALNDPQALARNAVWNLADGAGAGFRTLANPLRHMSRTPATPSIPPPRIGQHTYEVLGKELQLGTSELDRLVEDGVICKDKA